MDFRNINMDTRPNNRSIFRLLEASIFNTNEIIGLMKGSSPELRWLKECGMKHPQNKQERMLLNEKKKKEKQSRRSQVNDEIPREGNIEG